LANGRISLRRITPDIKIRGTERSNPQRESSFSPELRKILAGRSSPDSILAPKKEPVSA
jgi:hypothetical protein